MTKKINYFNRKVNYHEPSNYCTLLQQTNKKKKKHICFMFCCPTHNHLQMLNRKPCPVHPTDM